MSVVIPARNEAVNLPHVFKTLPPWVDEVVLVDGHSVDETVAVTRALCPKAKVVTQPGRGKGDALQAGFAAATGDIIVMIDADGSTDGGEMIRFVGALIVGADFAKGSRFSSSGGSDDITGMRRYGNRLLSALVNRMFGTHFTDLCYGYNAFWARHLDAIQIRNCPGFEVETLMNIRAAKAGLTIYEVPSHESPRIFGTSNLRAVRDGWRILKVIVREWAGGKRSGAAPTPAFVAAAALAEPLAGPYRLPGNDGEASVPDREIVAAIMAGDAAGVAAAFDRYAPQIHGYCRSQLAEPADAASAVQNTFLTAAIQISRLSQPDRLRPWLFALARNECQLLRGAALSGRLYEAAHAMDDTGTFAVTDQAEVRGLARAALAGLDPVDREISELYVRHGFYGADLAGILGVPPNRAHVLAARARSRLEKSLGVLLMAGSGRKQCPELGEILDSRGGKPAYSLRWQVRRHMRRCEVCGVRKRSGLHPAILLDLLPVSPMPADLRRRTLGLVCYEWPAGPAHRVRVIGRVTRFGADGFPVQAGTLSAPGWRIVSLPAAAAAIVAVAALVLLGAAMYWAAHPSGHDGSSFAVGRRLPSLGSTGPGGSAPPAAGDRSTAARAPLAGRPPEMGRPAAGTQARSGSAVPPPAPMDRRPGTAAPGTPGTPSAPGSRSSAPGSGSPAPAKSSPPPPHASSPPPSPPSSPQPSLLPSLPPPLPSPTVPPLTPGSTR